MKPEQIIIEPIITEKSTLERAIGRYVFRVHPKATKIDIKRAVRQVFNVEATDVNTCVVCGKSRGLGRSLGRTPSWKKAYIKLKSGQKIEKLEV